MKRSLLALTLVLLVACHRPQPAAPKAMRRVNDKISEVFKKITEEHRLAAVVPKDWTPDHLSATGEQLELGFVDSKGAPHTVTLLLNEPADGKTDGQGKVFAYRFVHGADQAADAQALLAAAGVIDAATGPDVLVSVQNAPPPIPPSPPVGVAEPSPPGGEPKPPPKGTPPGYSEPWEAKTISRPTALIIGAVQSLIIIGAILFAVIIPLRQRREEP